MPSLEQHAVPYTYSKGMAELKLRETFPELPLVVVRPSIVVGHSRLGCAPSGSIFWMLRMVALLETFSCRLTDRVDILSVDDCAEAIVRLATKPQPHSLLSYLDRCLDTSEREPITQQMQWDYK